MTEDAGRLRVASALEATGAYDGPLDLDLGNLAASDPSPFDPDVFGRKPSDVATAAALSGAATFFRGSSAISSPSRPKLTSTVGTSSYPRVPRTSRAPSRCRPRRSR